MESDQLTEDEINQIAYGYYEKFLAPSSGNVPAPAMAKACMMMIAAATAAMDGPMLDPAVRGREIGDTVEGLLRKIIADRERAENRPDLVIVPNDDDAA